MTAVNESHPMGETTMSTDTQYDVLDEVKARLTERMEELEPLHLEFLRLQRAMRTLDPERSPQRGRPAGSGATQDAVVRTIRAHPGLTLKEIASHIGIQPNYLYRALPQLEDRGIVRQERRHKKAARWFVREEEAASVNGDA